MESNTPCVSVLIPTHNRSNELGRAIQSVLRQSETSYEILVLDDASTEDLNNVILPFGNTNILLIRNNEKTNANVMRNIGLQHSRGEFIAMLDSDDEWLPNHLEEKLKLLDSPAIDGVYGSAFVFDGEQTMPAISRPMGAQQKPADYLLSNGSAPIPTWVMRSSCAKKIMFDNSLERHQDYDFFIRFAKQFHWHASHLPTIIIHWNKHQVRTRFPKSEQAFIAKFEKDVSPITYIRYHLSQLGYYSKNNTPNADIQHYRKACEKYPLYLTFADYCTLYPHHNFILNLFSFVWLIVRTKF